MMPLFLITLLMLLTAEAVAAPDTLPTSDPAAVSIDHVRVVFERRGPHVAVQQFIHLSVGEGQRFEKESGYRIGLPKGAFGSLPMKDDPNGIKVFQDHVSIKAPITSKRAVHSIRFNLPVRDGVAILDQRLGSRIFAAQAISTWTIGDVELRGQGFAPQEIHELSGGIQGIVISGQNIGDGHLFVTLLGLFDGSQKVRGMLAIGLAIVMLLIGFVLWLRHKPAGPDRPHLEDGLGKG